MTRRDAVKEELLENDSEFQRLYEAHQSHERRLDELLEGTASDADELELKSIKIQKLHLKDRMEEIIRDRLARGASAAS